MQEVDWNEIWNQQFLQMQSVGKVSKEYVQWMQDVGS